MIHACDFGGIPIGDITRKVSDLKYFLARNKVRSVPGTDIQSGSIGFIKHLIHVNNVTDIPLG